MNKTEREWCLHRARLSCKIGMDALNVIQKDGEPVVLGPDSQDYAIYCLLMAVDNMAESMQKQVQEDQK